MTETAASPQVTHEVERLLYREARLLDEGRFHEWLALFTADVRYWVPVRETLPGDREGVPDEDAIAVAHIDEDKAGLELRIRRYDTGRAHVETPPSRTRHLVCNIEVHAGDDPGRVTAFSNFLLFQGRRDSSESLFSGRREDRLRQADGRWLISFRKVLLDHTVLPRAISMFF